MTMKINENLMPYKISNEEGTSTTDGYSQYYINNKSKCEEILSSTISSGTSTLTNPYTDYDFLIITWSPYYSTGNRNSITIPTSIITSDASWEDEDWQSSSVYAVITLNFPTTSTIELAVNSVGTWTSSAVQLFSVVGVKL